jgi:hypothetical protein
VCVWQAIVAEISPRRQVPFALDFMTTRVSIKLCYCRPLCMRHKPVSIGHELIYTWTVSSLTVC